MIENFRYSSSWEQFEYSVKELKKLLSQNQAYWMIGYLKDLDIYIDETVQETLQEDVVNIIHDEILYLLFVLLENGNLIEENLKEALDESNPELSDEESQEIITCVHNKLELVKDAFDINKLAIRYGLKKQAITNKLSAVDFNIYSTKLLDGESVRCAIINLSSQKELKTLNKIPLSIFLQDNAQKDEVSFLFDEEDLNLLIHQLETIRRKMEEY